MGRGFAAAVVGVCMCALLMLRTSNGYVYRGTGECRDPSSGTTYAPGDVYYLQQRCERCQCSETSLLVAGEVVESQTGFECSGCGVMGASVVPSTCYIGSSAALNYPMCCPRVICEGDQDFDQSALESFHNPSK